MSAVRVGSLCYAGWLSVFVEFMQQWLPGFAEVESAISVDVIWMHLNFDGFSAETIHVAGFRRDWSNPTNQRLLNTVLIMITSSDYKTLSSSLRKPATWIVSSEKSS